LKNWLIALCLALSAGLATQAHANKAVNFSFVDSKGKAIQLSDYRGKWVLVNFWAPWCPRCKMEFPDLNDLDARADFVVIGVAMDYGIDEASVHNTVQRFNLRFPQVIGGNRRDPTNPALQIGPVDFYPTSYLYAPNGEIVMFVPGVVSKKKLIAFTEQYQAPAPLPGASAVAEAAAPAAAAAAVAATAPTKPSGVQKASLSKPATKTKATTQDKKKVTTVY
jgi:thiol-disulfide isomerase/thioredoxin